MLLNDYFNVILKDLNCNPITKAYIINIFDKYKTIDHDLSNQNITLTYANGVFNNDFETFQKLADWLFFTKCLFPEFLRSASPEYYNNIAQLSYYNCYRIVRSWKVYEQLADEFVILTNNTRNQLSGKISC